MKLNNIRLMVSEFDKTFLFYRDVLGFQVTWGKLGENYAHFKLPTGGELAIFDKKLMSQAIGTSQLPPNANGQDKFALIISVDNVDELYKRLSAKRVKFLNKPQDKADWGIRTVHLRDPEGNLIEFVSELND